MVRFARSSALLALTLAWCGQTFAQGSPCCQFLMAQSYCDYYGDCLKYSCTNQDPVSCLGNGGAPGIDCNADTGYCAASLPTCCQYTVGYTSFEYPLFDNNVCTGEEPLVCLSNGGSPGLGCRTDITSPDVGTCLVALPTCCDHGFVTDFSMKCTNEPPRACQDTGGTFRFGQCSNASGQCEDLQIGPPIVLP